MMICSGLEEKGIRTVMITDEFAGVDGASQSLADATPHADAVVSVGNANERILLPNMDKVIGDIQVIEKMAGGKSGSLSREGIPGRTAGYVGSHERTGIREALSARWGIGDCHGGETESGSLSESVFPVRWGRRQGRRNRSSKAALRAQASFFRSFSARSGDRGNGVCGDNYFGEHIDEATERVLSLIKGFNPDIVVAGPAFNAGRYGIACGSVCAAVVDRLGIPAVAGMHPENPGVDAYRKTVYIVETKGTTAGMREAALKMSRLVLKLVKGEPLGSPEEEGYFPRGIRRNFFADETGAVRRCRCS
jgi:hypothetical protein